MNKSNPPVSDAPPGDDPPGCTVDHVNEVVPPNEAHAHAFYDGYVTFENGLSVNGPREQATVCVNNITNTITVTMKNPASVFVAPGYPIVIEGPAPKNEEDAAQLSRGKGGTAEENTKVRRKETKTKDLYF